MKPKKLNIWIVEDDVMYSKLVHKFVKENYDCELTVYNSGEALIRDLDEKNRPDIVLLDYDLGSYRGRFIFDLLRAHDPTVQVILLSGITDLKDIQEMLSKGIYDHIQKNTDEFSFLEQDLNLLISFKELELEFSNEML